MKILKRLEASFDSEKQFGNITARVKSEVLSSANGKKTVSFFKGDKNLGTYFVNSFCNLNTINQDSRMHACVHNFIQHNLYCARKRKQISKGFPSFHLVSATKTHQSKQYLNSFPKSCFY